SKDKKALYKATQHKSFKKGQGLPGYIWQTGDMQNWSSASNNKNFVRKEAFENASIESVCGLPLFYNKELIGVVILGVTKDRSINKRFTSLYERLSDHLSLEIKRKQLEQDLSQI